MPTEKFKRKRSAKNCNNEYCDKILKIIDKCKQEHRYYNDYEKEDNVFKIINHIRNAIAHGGDIGLHFYPVKDGSESVIEGIIFYDCEYEMNKKSKNPKPEEKVQEFCLDLRLEDIQELVKSISELYVSMEKIGGLVKEYDEQMQFLKNLLRNGRDEGEKSVAAMLCED